MKVQLSFYFCLLTFTLYTQTINIVWNPSFEKQTPDTHFPECGYTKYDKQFNQAVAHWNTFMGYTPDLIISKSDTSASCFYPAPHSGKRMAGIITYHPGTDTGYEHDFHEYLNGELKAPLKVGKTFLIEFYVHQDDSTAIHHLRSVYGRKSEIIPTASNNIGVYFLEKPMAYKTNIWEHVKYNSIQPHFNVNEIIKTGATEWVKISGTFTADRPYRYFIIGNFFTDDLTETTIENASKIESFNLATRTFWKKKKRVAYYCIDDVRIAPADAPISTNIARILTKKQTYTFEQVNFESGKSDLRPNALPELNDLADFLKKQPNVKIEIGGHTDNIGSASSNQQLSEKRAQSVYNYLIQKEVQSEQLSFKGYGEEKPITQNDTPEGRLENRRVECRIIN